MLSLLNGLTLSQHPALLMRRMHDDRPVSAFRRSIRSSKRYSGLEGSDEVFESRVEETDGSGLKRVVVERGLGSKAMKLTQVSDGSGGTTEERVFTNVSKEEESLFEDSHWPQAAAKHMHQTPVKALPDSVPADTPNNDAGSSTTTPQDPVCQVPAAAEQEVDESGVPIAGSFEASDDGRFHAAETAKSGPDVNATVQQDQHQQQQQQQSQQKQQQMQQQSRQNRRVSSRHRTAVDADPFSRQLLALQQLSRAFSPSLCAFDAWPVERPGLYFPYALAPVYDPFAHSMLRHPLIDVRF